MGYENFSPKNNILKSNLLELSCLISDVANDELALLFLQPGDNVEKLIRAFENQVVNRNYHANLRGGGAFS